MAMEWIKWTKGFGKKPEVMRIAVSLGITRRECAAACMELFEWADDNLAECNAVTVTFALLDSLIGVTGFAQAMCDVGWLLDHGDSVEFHNFDRHNGQTAKQRAVTSKRVQKHRAKSNGASVTSVTPRPLPEKKRKESPPTPRRGACGACVETLRRAGADPKRIDPDKLARLSTGDVIAHWCEINRDTTVKSAGAVLASRCNSDSDPPRLTADAVTRAVREGVVATATYAGAHIDLAGVKHNSAGLCRDGAVLIPTNELNMAEYA